MNYYPRLPGSLNRGLLRPLALASARTSESHLFEGMVIGTLKRHQGMNRCGSIGRVRNHNQLRVKGMCYNLKKMLLRGAI